VSAARLAAPLALLLALTLARPARAADEENAFRSPQHFALELRFGPYAPDVDNEFGGGQTPHRDYFGDSRRLMSQLELDVQLFQAFGTLGVGFSVGIFRESAQAFLEPSAGQSATERAGDSTKLMLVPLAAMLVYRLDQAARYARFPLVPYGKLGLNYTWWSIYDGNDEIVDPHGSPPGRGRGFTPGWQGAVGVSLLLDVLDPGAARALDGEVGINHTYVFGELAKVQSTGSGKLHVGGSTWYLGLMFEF
jgi:hypothetical protein